MVKQFAPFRISLMGGGTDYPDFYTKYGAHVITSTIVNKGVTVYMKEMDDLFPYKFEVITKDIQRCNNVDEIKHPAVRNTLKYFNIQNARIICDSDFPSGTGTGSSSAFIIAMIKCISQIKNIYLTKENIAKIAIVIERLMCDEAGGTQDQIEIAYEGLNKISYKKGYDIIDFDIEPLRIKDYKTFSNSFVLVYTGATRKSFILSEVQKENTKNNLNNDYLLSISKLTNEFEKEIKKEIIDYKIIGNLLTESWKIKKKLANGITNDYIDELFDNIMNAGAYGGKLIGAGNGGFILALVPEENRKIFNEKIKNKVIDIKLK